MYKLREWLVSGTFFSMAFLFSMLVSVGWGLAHPTTYAAVDTKTAGDTISLMQAAEQAESSFLGGIQIFGAWDKSASAGSGNQPDPKDARAAEPSAAASAAAMVAAQTPATSTPATDSAPGGKPAPSDVPAAVSTPSAAPDSSDKPAAAVAKPAKKPVQIASESPKILIYHTHNRESYYPELKKGTKDASSKTVNVTLVGKRLAASLEKLGIPTLHEVKDYPSTVPKFNYAYSYKYSKQTVVDALSANKELTFLFDIHRDSQKRNKTTVELNGKDYAKLLFVIGERNPHWKENKKFAEQLHKALNAKYPGISRGVLSKGPKTGNAEYNQSLSKNSLVVEMGGVDNTLEENYRTADALASVINELFGDSDAAAEKQ